MTGYGAGSLSPVPPPYLRLPVYAPSALPSLLALLRRLAIDTGTEEFSREYDPDNGLYDFKDDPAVAVLLATLSMRQSLPRQRLEFLARTLFVETRPQMLRKLVRGRQVLLGTPVYVAMVDV